MSAFPTKNLIFLKCSKNNFNFLVDSGASISILPHSSSAPPTGPRLVGANGDVLPVWGRRRQTVRQAVEYCTIYLNPHVGGNGYNTCVRIACMRNVYIGIPRSGRSLEGRLTLVNCRRRAASTMTTFCFGKIIVRGIYNLCT